MLYNEDKRIKLPVPFLQDETILYVDSRIGSSYFYVEEHLEDLVSRFEDIGYTFLFLPDLVGELSPGVLHYMFPGQKDILLVDDMYQEIQDFAHLGDKTGFLYKQENLTYFRVIPEAPLEAIGAAVDDFISFLNLSQVKESSSIRFRIAPKKDEELFSLGIGGESEILDEMELPEPCGSDIRFSVRKSEDSLDPMIQSIIDEWERLADKFGITIQDLEVILGYKVKLSRLYITTSNRIYLADMEGRPEVKLDDLTKALYFFYLKHPQGAAFKELQSFEKEILHLYMGITGRDDLDGIRKSVASLVSPYSDGRNSCVSRIKKAFRDIVGDHIAKNYYIDGQYAGVRKVSIDRDLVIWEH